MSREIKFRAWDKEEKEYYYNAEHTYDFFCSNRGCYAESFGEVLDQPDRFILEQYTGLKDKNGKEIYEGDIVDYAGGCICVIQYEDEGARFIHRDISDDFPFGFNGLEEYNGKLFEVIGNTHENPELLGGEEC